MAQNTVRLVEEDGKFEVLVKRKFLGFLGSYWEPVWRGSSLYHGEIAFNNMVKYGTPLNVVKQYDPELETTLNEI